MVLFFCQPLGGGTTLFHIKHYLISSEFWDWCHTCLCIYTAQYMDWSWSGISSYGPSSIFFAWFSSNFKLHLLVWMSWHSHTGNWMYWHQRGMMLKDTLATCTTSPMQSNLFFFCMFGCIWRPVENWFSRLSEDWVAIIFDHIFSNICHYTLTAA